MLGSKSAQLVNSDSDSARWSNQIAEAAATVMAAVMCQRQIELVTDSIFGSPSLPGRRAALIS